MIMSTPKQRQLIGIFRKRINLSLDDYQLMLDFYGVKTSKNLNKADAEKLIRDLKNKAYNLGVFLHSQIQHKKFDNLARRHGMATPAQLRKIDVMWKNVSNQKTNEAKEKALNTFLEKITGKKRLNFLTHKDVEKVINAIEAMSLQK